jgi:hypothetical protein
MRLGRIQEAYRRAELRLRALLFGDELHYAGRLRGEEPRQDAVRELRRMRVAFEEAVDEGERGLARAELAEDLVEKAHQGAVRSRSGTGAT